MPLTSDRFMWNLFFSYLPKTKEVYSNICATQLFFCVWRGRGWGTKVDSDSNMNTKLVKVQCNLWKEVPKFGNSNPDAFQLQLEQEERNRFNTISLVPSSFTYSLVRFFSGERSVWTCMAGCKQPDIYVYPLYTPAQPQEKRCFHAPFSVLVLSSLSWGELVKELGNEYPDLFPWASHILKEAPNYIWR